MNRKRTNIGIITGSGKERSTQSMSELLEKILDKKNMNEAYKKVCANKGAGGIDGMELDGFIRKNWDSIKEQIRTRSYKPQPVRRVEIPKPNGSKRKLGIPIVMDRIIQQGIVQIISPMCEFVFSDYSYGFRPNRSCEMAVRDMLEFLNEGYEWIVDIDLEKFFDNVPQDKYEKTEQGTSQGGVISPVLANMFLQYVFDMWMKRNFPQASFERYADDGIVHCRTKEEALYIKARLVKRFEECKLEIHPVKTRIVYCKDKDRTMEEEQRNGSQRSGSESRNCLLIGIGCIRIVK